MSSWLLNGPGEFIALIVPSQMFRCVTQTDPAIAEGYSADVCFTRFVHQVD
jgi:hypothetical protein